MITNESREYNALFGWHCFCAFFFTMKKQKTWFDVALFSFATYIIITRNDVYFSK
jgi:hypothetical protein